MLVTLYHVYIPPYKKSYILFDVKIVVIYYIKYNIKYK